MERNTTFGLTARSINILTTTSKSMSRSAIAVTPSVRVLGKLCPCCGAAGAVLCETKRRIIYECPNRHQYETKKRVDDLYNDCH
jgi:hypothetical protein